MTIARAHLIDPSLTRRYHCVTRCVRRASLLAEGASDRQAWIDNRLQELAGIFSIAVGGFSVLDNHLHVLVRLDPEVAAGWSDEELVRRWGPPEAGFPHATNSGSRSQFPTTGSPGGSRMPPGWPRPANGCKASVGS